MGSIYEKRWNLAVKIVTIINDLIDQGYFILDSEHCPVFRKFEIREDQIVQVISDNTVIVFFENKKSHRDFGILDSVKEIKEIFSEWVFIEPRCYVNGVEDLLKPKKSKTPRTVIEALQDIFQRTEGCNLEDCQVCPSTKKYMKKVCEFMRLSDDETNLVMGKWNRR